MIEDMSYYKSVTVNWSSVPKEGAAHGQRNIVEIKNNVGTKTVESLNKKGRVIKRVKKTLKNGDMSRILHGKFVPGLWKDCGGGVKCAARNMTRKHK